MASKVEPCKIHPGQIYHSYEYCVGAEPFERQRTIKNDGIDTLLMNCGSVYQIITKQNR